MHKIYTKTGEYDYKTTTDYSERLNKTEKSTTTVKNKLKKNKKKDEKKKKK